MDRLDIRDYALLTIIGMVMFTCARDANTEENYNITAASVIVNWYDSEEELMQAVGEYSAAGWSQCEYRPEFNISFCEFWLVRPKLQYADIDYVCVESDGYNFDTIGHEFYHAFIGDHHAD